MKNLINQILKFGVVGFFCFLIDFGLTTGLANIVGVHYSISLICYFRHSQLYFKHQICIYPEKENGPKEGIYSIFDFVSHRTCH